LPQVAERVRVLGHEEHGHAGAREARGVVEPSAEARERGRKIARGAHDHRHVRGRDPIGDAPTLFDAGEHEPDAVLGGELDRAQDVGRARDAHDQRQATVEDLREALEVEAAHPHLAQAAPVEVGAARSIEPRVVEDLAEPAQRHRHRAAGRVHAVRVEVDVHGELADGDRLTRGRSVEVGERARAGAGDEASGGRARHVRHAEPARDRDQRRARVVAVGGRERRPDRIGALALRRLVVRALFEADLDEAARRLGAEEAGCDDPALGVDHGRAGRDRAAGRHRHDAIALDHDRRAVDGIVPPVPRARVHDGERLRGGRAREEHEERADHRGRSTGEASFGPMPSSKSVGAIACDRSCTSRPSM
jgi:hypothetical protein